MKTRTLIRIIGPLILVVLLLYWVDLEKTKEILVKIDPRYFLLGVAMFPVLVLIRSTRWRFFLRQYGIRYSHWKCYRIYFVGLVTITVIPAVGTFIKVVYPRREGHNLLDATLSVMADKYLDYYLPVILGITSAVLVALKFDPLLSLFMIVATLSLMRTPAQKTISFFSSRIIPARINALAVKRGWNLQKRLDEMAGLLTPKVYWGSILGFLVYYFAIFFLCRSLAIEIRFSELVLIEAMTALVTAIPISVFGLGTRDLGLVATFSFFGYTAEQAIALSAALLLLRLAVVAIGLVFWVSTPPDLTRSTDLYK